MTVPEFQRCKSRGEKLILVTAYDVLFARIVEEAGIDVIIVGDSLGMVVQGKRDTLSVTMEDMVYHTTLVARGVQRSMIVSDMPFLSYQVSVEETVRNAGRLLQAGATAVKIEGGEAVIDRVQTLTRFGIPVMGHLGMTPQSHQMYGGYKVQGKDSQQAEQLVRDACALEGAGVFGIVLEAIPAGLAQRITERLTIPSIGIGAGPGCDGQVLVLHDLLGLFDEFIPRYVKPYAHLKADAIQALRRYKEEVQGGKFPTDSESYR